MVLAVIVIAAKFADETDPEAKEDTDQKQQKQKSIAGFASIFFEGLWYHSSLKKKH